MDHDRLRTFLGTHEIRASAPCRIDMGGTLDIRTFSYPLHAMEPTTVNMALALRTEVAVDPFDPGVVKVSSAGFDPAAFPAGEAPYTHPLGLMFAVADALGLDGVHIRIRSASPPRSALGGSSVAAVALVAALSRLLESAGRPAVTRHQAAMIAHAVEESVAGVPCGTQDQLAAAFGGANAWHWTSGPEGAGYERRPLGFLAAPGRFENHVLVAYCGVPHESRDINRRWVRAFLAGKDRERWREIARLTRRFAAALEAGDLSAAGAAMNEETDIRKAMTPDVLDEVGNALAAAGRDMGCGVRFTGAGGGGCLWALGPRDPVAGLRTPWESILAGRPDGRLLDAPLDGEGLRVDCRVRE